MAMRNDIIDIVALFGRGEIMLGERLVQLRKAKKLTQQQIADKLHLTRGTYAQYEINRRVPEYATLEKLADFFEVSIDFLVGRGYPEPTKDQTEFVIKEIVDRYNVDLNVPGNKEKLEQLIKLVFDDMNKPKGT